MKEAVAWITVLIVAAALVCACAEQEDSFFSQFDNFEWSFCSGVGGWSTDLRIFPDGTFSGTYHDSEMGETADDYPDGTLYCCSFTGRLSLVGQLDENTWKIRVDELKVDENTEKEYIDDGIRFVFSEPYGLSEEDEMLLYRPGMPVDGFSYEMQLFAHLFDREDPAAELETWFLWSEMNESGFVGIQYDALV